MFFYVVYSVVDLSFASPVFQSILTFIAVAINVNMPTSVM